MPIPRRQLKIKFYGMGMMTDEIEQKTKFGEKRKQQHEQQQSHSGVEECKYGI
jgi:hypothetical protein